MSEWVETTLGNIATFQNGYPFKPGELGGEKLPVIRIKQLLDPAAPVDHTDVEVAKRFHIRTGDLIFSWSATLASVIWDRGPAALNQHLFRVNEVAGVERRWLHYALDHAVDDLMEKSHGTTMKHVTKKVLGAHPVRVPPLVEQRRIVDVMASVDAQIEALQAEAERLASTTVRLRGDTFGGLDAVTVPAGQKFDMLLGRQKSARQSVGEHVLPYLRAANITAGSLKLTDVQTMNFDPREQEKYGLRVDDVVLVEGGSLGQAARWQGEIDGVVGFDKHVIRLRAREGFSTSEYALQWSHWARQTGQFDAQATGITIKALGFGRASAMPVPDLNLVEQARVTGPLAAADAQVAAVTAELTRLRACRSTLLGALLNQDFEIPESYDDLLASNLEVAS